MDYKSLTDSQLSNIFDGIEFKTPPMRHQLISLAFALDERKRVAYWHDIGTGKSFTSLYTADLWCCEKILVVCPNSVLPGWSEQITEHTDFRFVMLTGTKAERQEKLKQDADVYVINYEGLRWLFGDYVEDDLGKKTFVIDRQLIKDSGFDCLICDECHKLKNTDSIQTKICRAISLSVRYCQIMTGSPIAKNERDLWSEFYVLDNGATLGTSEYQFLNTHFRKGSYDWKITKSGRKKILDDIAKTTLRFDRSECFDLPDKTYQTRWLDMTAEQRQLTNDIVNQTRIELEKGEIEKLDILQQINKLAQITGGFIIGSEGIVRLKQNPKIVELESLLTEEVRDKCIIFHNYVEEGRMIEELLDKLEIPYASLRGEIKDKKRQYERFKYDDSCRVLVAHPKSGGEGLNFQEASIAVFFSNGYEGATTRLQAEGRIWRYSQKKACLFIDLSLKCSIDERKLQIMNDKSAIAKSALDYIRTWQGD